MGYTNTSAGTYILYSEINEAPFSGMPWLNLFIEYRSESIKIINEEKKGYGVKFILKHLLNLRTWPTRLSPYSTEIYIYFIPETKTLKWINVNAYLRTHIYCSID